MVWLYRSPIPCNGEEGGYLTRSYDSYEPSLRLKEGGGISTLCVESDYIKILLRCIRAYSVTLVCEWIFRPGTTWVK